MLTRNRVPTGTAEPVVNHARGFADLYVHRHNSAVAVTVPEVGVPGVLVTGTSADNDTHIAPGGRNADGEFRLGMRPGGTYTVSVSVRLSEPLTGGLNPNALRIVPGYTNRSGTVWRLAASPPARNEYGDHRISVTFTVPTGATSAWIRLISGMSQGHGEVYWHSLILTAGERVEPYFDGDTPADTLYTYAWRGTTGESQRTLRPLAEIDADPAVLADLAVRHGEDDLLAELDDPLATARRRIAAGDEADARRTLRGLAKEGSGDAVFELGRLEERAGNWAAAERLYRRALTAGPSSERAYRLAAVLDKLKRRADSKATSAQGLTLDGELPFDGPAVLDMDVKCFGARREVGIFLDRHLPQLRVQARQRLERPAVTGLDRPVFVYWAQGFAAAPPLVRRCLAELHANNPGADIHELSDADVRYYADMPEDLPTGNKTHFSDLLRLALLERYGGVWLDATVYVSEPLAPRLDELLGAGGLFAFNYTGPFVSSWMLAARPGSYAVHLWRAALWLWWEKRGELIDYYLLHHFFEMLHHLDPEFAAEWQAGTRLSARPPHAMQEAMLDPYDPDAYDGFLAGSFAHKLRFKYRPEQVGPGSTVAHFIRGDHRRAPGRTVMDFRS